MRVVLDTNVLVSALMVRDRPPFQLVQAWLGDRLELITSEEQLEEFRRITRSARMRAYIASHEAGGLANQFAGARDVRSLDRGLAGARA